MPEHAVSGTLAGQDPFQGLEIPPQLEDSLQRHRDNLARLVRSLRTAGCSEEQIDQSVSAVVASYKEELTRAIKLLVR